MDRSIAAIKHAETRAAACGVTLRELHAAAGVHRATWNRWRLGASGPNLDQLAAVDELLTRRAAPSKAPTNAARRSLTHTPIPSHQNTLTPERRPQAATKARQSARNG